MKTGQSRSMILVNSLDLLSLSKTLEHCNIVTWALHARAIGSTLSYHSARVILLLPSSPRIPHRAVYLVSLLMQSSVAMISSSSPGAHTASLVESSYILSTCPVHFIWLFTNLPISHFSMHSSFLRSSILLQSTLFTPAICLTKLFSHIVTPDLSIYVYCLAYYCQSIQFGDIYIYI